QRLRSSVGRLSGSGRKDGLRRGRTKGWDFWVLQQAANVETKIERVSGISPVQSVRDQPGRTSRYSRSGIPSRPVPPPQGGRGRSISGSSSPSSSILVVALVQSERVVVEGEDDLRQHIN